MTISPRDHLGPLELAVAEMSAMLGADLAALSVALEPPEADLAALLEDLASSVGEAVDSFQGLTLRTVSGDQPFTLTTMTTTTQAAATSSLRLPLPAMRGCEPSSLLLYASTPGAFIDMAADLSFALGVGLDAVGLDQDLYGLLDQASREGLHEFSVINQAIGILIERGFLPEQARGALDRLAETSDSSIVDAAHALIQTTAEHRDSETCTNVATVLGDQTPSQSTWCWAQSPRVPA